MDERSILLELLRLALRDTPADSPRAKALLAWCETNAAALGLPETVQEAAADDRLPARRWHLRRPKRTETTSSSETWGALCRTVGAAASVSPADAAPLLVVATRLAALLTLDAGDTRLLQTVVAIDRLRLAAALCHLLKANGIEPALLVMELAGFDSFEALRQSQAVRLGLIDLSIGRDGGMTIEAAHCVHRLMNVSPAGEEAMIECLVGVAAPPKLGVDDFAGQREDLALLCRILRGALADGAKGINILLYGPPGTGKTELAKTLAAAAGARLYAVGETDEFGDEPERWERVNALKLAQQLLAGRRDVVLLFDEMEDLIGDMLRADSGRHYSRRPGSKVYVNRLFEDNAVPTIWTSNAIDNVDPAILRRMSYVLKMDLPSVRAREAILGRIACDEGLELSPATIERLAGSACEATTVARNALRSARLLKGGEVEVRQVLEALVTGVRHGRRLARSNDDGRDLDLALYQSSTSIVELFEKLSAPGAPADFSLLMTGPPGTGKTALARHLAQRLDRPLLVKRASDLLSKWVGETERQIAGAFAEARDSGGILLFDEVDSLLFDRGSVERSWEVSQVNELLTWMDNHPLPFIAATNHAGRLDSAALRRFIFKLKLEALGPAAAAKAFQTFFKRPAPPRLAEIAGLTPGDFAVVARQLRFRQEEVSADDLVTLLAREAAAKPGLPGRIGFRPVSSDA